MSRRGIVLDFAGTRRGPAHGRRLLLALTFVAAAWSLFTLLEYRAALGRAEAGYEKAIRRSEGQRTPAASPEQRRQLAEQVKALNGYIRNLNLPWDAVIGAVRPPSVLNIYFLGLESAEQGGLLRIAAQASRAEDMTEYLAYLAEKPRLSGVVLTRHEVQKDGSYQFELEARWKAAP